MSPGAPRAVVAHELVAAAALIELTAQMRATVPGLEIVRDKAASRFMRALNVVVRVFAPEFLTRFVTVIGATIYVPAGAWADAARLFRVFAHEWVHALRAQGCPIPGEASCHALAGAHGWHRFQWSALYLFPQSLAVLSLLAVLAWPFGAGWLWALVALAALAPWPAPFRLREELAAYAVSVRLTPEAERAALRAHVVDMLCGWPYYRAGWRRARVAAALLEAETWPCAEARAVIGASRAILDGRVTAPEVAR